MSRRHASATRDQALAERLGGREPSGGTYESFAGAVAGCDVVVRSVHADRARMAIVIDRTASATKESSTGREEENRLTELVPFAPQPDIRGQHAADSLMRQSLRSEQVEAKGLWTVFPTFGLGRAVSCKLPASRR